VSTENKLDDIEEQVDDITEANDELKKKIIGEDGKGGIVAALGKEISQVDEILKKYQGRVSYNGSIIEAY
jgi:hypothetical protein